MTRSRPDVPTRPLRANIISWESGGLGADVSLLERALREAGCEVWFSGRRHRRARGPLHSKLMTLGALFAQQWARLTGRPPFDVNFFIESVFPEHLPTARVNGLWVHPEWFRETNLPHVHRLDWILCKTASAVAYMEGLPAPARLLAWTSPDRRLPAVRREGPVRCLHLAGASAVKGTEAVIAAWARHPEWPALTIVRRRGYGGDPLPELPPLPNVRYETDFLPAETVQRLQNECEVHVQPSQAEGYGHVLGEAMSCEAVVVTTDAPPMNELITPERGVLVRVARAEPMRRSMRNWVDVDDLERQLARVFAMAPAERAALGRAARAWYEEEARRFPAALRAVLDEVARARQAKASA